MRIVKCALLTLLVLFCFGGVAFAEDALIVHGKDFAFKVTEPSGWEGITNDANRYRVNVYFRMPGYDFNSSPALMYIRVLAKNGLTVSQHIQADMDAFSQKKKRIAFEAFDISNLKYEHASRKYIINDNQIDFLCYIDPGEKWNNYVILALTAPRDLAEKNCDVFISLVRSFLWVRAIEHKSVNQQ
ncbi:hypothetical protein [Anaeroselena agilis]|uniref:PsbP C-terminal domain-containing protein n=1 Tax=Anaeroselena agilis TaxID=3063788 RepID=A0ABU3NV54_9FIRM|nr:hypothetical protein [Selenomonadales bacterium 4137-cl]